MKKEIRVVYSSHLTDTENIAFSDHVAETIGVKHSIHCYPNHNEYSLTEVYNLAIQDYHDDKAIMVFCHNDIIFKTKDWGKKLLGKFNNLDYQIIGVAGGIEMGNNCRWWDKQHTMVGIVEHTNGLRNWVSEYSKESYIGVKDTVLIDGLFMAIDTTELAHFFDEDFKGFHFYDVNLCLDNYLAGLNIGVVTDIRILHKSIGMTNQAWEENRIQCVKKYKDELPILLHNEK